MEGHHESAQNLKCPLSENFQHSFTHNGARFNLKASRFPTDDGSLWFQIDVSETSKIRFVGPQPPPVAHITLAMGTSSDEFIVKGNYKATRSHSDKTRGLVAHSLTEIVTTTGSVLVTEGLTDEGQAMYEKLLVNPPPGVKVEKVCDMVFRLSP